MSLENHPKHRLDTAATNVSKQTDYTGTSDINQTYFLK